MHIEYTNSKYINTDLNVTCFGFQACSEEHFWGPGIREYYLLHYVVKGKGRYKVGEQTYDLKKGNVFLIEPHVLTYYIADKEDPWEYVWIGFNGTKAKEYISSICASPVFQCREDHAFEACIMEMVELSQEQQGRDLLLQSLLYKFLYLLTNNLLTDNKIVKTDMPKIYVETATNFIYNNYFNDISIEEVASHVNITRAYLFRLFKKYLSTSPQQFLINLRLQKAQALIENSTLCIGDVARSVGYRDVLLFSKVFKKSIGLTPSEFRKNKNLS